MSARVAAPPNGGDAGGWGTLCRGVGGGSARSAASFTGGGRGCCTSWNPLGKGCSTPWYFHCRGCSTPWWHPCGSIEGGSAFTVNINNNKFSNTFMEQRTLDAIGVLIISTTVGGGVLGRLRCNVDLEEGK